MIPRGQRFMDGCRTIRVQAGQENSGFDLCAGDVRRELNRLDRRRPVNRQWGAAVFGTNPRTHAFQGHNDPPHRTTAQRIVARHRGPKGVGRQDSGKHSHGAARISGVEHAGRGRQAAKAAAADRQREATGVASGLVDGHAQGTEAANRRCAVAAGGVASDFGAAIGQRGEQRIAM
jgi:hypothetical protein